MDERGNQETSISEMESSCNQDANLPEEEVANERGERNGGKVLDASSEERTSLKMKILRIIVSVMLVITGSINTLAAKWADVIVINGRYFKHPFFQANVMFVGEICCGIAYFVIFFVQRLRWKRQHRKVVNSRRDDQKSGHNYEETDGKNDLEKIDENLQSENVMQSYSNISEIPQIPRFNYFLFIAPAFCDVFATSIQYVGLTLTSASSYQMLRGSVIIFTGLLSKLCLHTKLQLYRWIGMFVVVAGLIIVGVADIIYSHDTEEFSSTSILVGDILIVIAQSIVAIQMVVEQKLLADFDTPPLLAVGLEGIFGFTILTILMVPMYFIRVPSMFSNSPENRLEDALDAFQEMHDSGELVGALCLTIVSIAFFNFAGLSVTKYMNATTRMVLDSVRTIIIWALSIPLFHSNFIPLQLLGFALLIFGMFMYNDVLIGPLLRKTKCGRLIYPASRVKDVKM